MRIPVYLTVFIISVAVSYGQKISHRIFIISNLVDQHDEFKHLEDLVEMASEYRSSILMINGDAAGTIPEDRFIEAVRILSAWKGNIIILPGDRDWDSSGPEGDKMVKRWEKVVEGLELDNVFWPLEKGCPGPKLIEVGEHLSIVMINTQWFNHPFDKPRPEDGDCKYSTIHDFFDELEDVLDESVNRNVLIAGHYPVVSNGRYAGNAPWHKHLTPPVIGGFIQSFHRNIGSTLDISNHLYGDFRSHLYNVIQSHKSIIYVSGHEKDVQIIREADNYFLNAGGRICCGEPDDNTNLPLRQESGFLGLNFFNDGKITANVYNRLDDVFQIKESMEFTLYVTACGNSGGAVPTNTSYIPCKERLMVEPEMSGTYPDRVLVTAGEEYRAGGLKRFFLGDHYRQTWTTPVSVPVLDLDKQFDGLVPYQRGGGRQTLSLKIKGNDGMEYVFRSVNKDPAKALPFELRETVVADVLRDQTTTQHPYGAMAVDIMLNELEVLHAHPVLYSMPDDPKLGPFRGRYGNLLGMLEEKPLNPKKVDVPFDGADEVLRSHKLFREMFDDHDITVKSTEFIHARVFDILVGDWGKHEDNWKWTGYETEDGMEFRPVPRDRDHVFSRWDGFFPWLADREWAKPSGENFDYQIKDIRSLMWQARHLDRFIANKHDRNDWLAAASYVKERITDEVIDRAVRNMPEEIYEFSGREIADKLKARRNDLDKYALEYYLILAREVDVVGSNKAEYFEIERKSDGTVEVKMFDQDDGEKDESELLYSRVFRPEETREIRVFGLDGNDTFIVTGTSQKSIRLRLIGGPGRDKISDTSLVRKGSPKTRIYERSRRAEIIFGKEGKMMKTPNRRAFNYDRTAFAYHTYFPTPFIGYNTDNGLFASFGVNFTRQRYGRPDFHARHGIRAGASSEGNLTFDLNTRFRHVLGKWDATASFHVGYPNSLNFFFGEGNETTKDQTLFDTDYYRAQYNSLELGAGLIRDFWTRSSFTVGFRYQNAEADINQGTILSDPLVPDVFGEDPVNTLEIKATLDLDFRDNPGLPSNGSRLHFSHRSGHILSGGEGNYGLTKAFVEQFYSLKWRNPATVGLVLGWSDNYGDVPFYNLYYLGQGNHLRGYFRNRFTGDRTYFFNSNLRFQFKEAKTAVVPMKYGMRFFLDMGRVVVEEAASSSKWHAGYGAGFYLVPLRNEYSINLSVAFSEEESGLILLGVGRVF